MDVKTIPLVITDAARRAALRDALRLESHSVLAGTGRTLAATATRRRPAARATRILGLAG